MRLTQLLRCTSALPPSYHNMPQRYVDRNTKFIEYRAPKLPHYVRKVIKYRKNAYYDIWRPWQREFQELNRAGSKVPHIYVEPIKEWPMFRGDRVELMTGPDKGKQGYINYIVKQRNWVCVEGLNLERTREEYPDTEGMVSIKCSEKPLLINHEVKLVDPTDLLPTDIEWRFDDQGKRVRVSSRTQRVIPIPRQAFETIDYVDPKGYRDQPKDTDADEAAKITFKPRAMTFEMEICEQVGIKDDRVPYPMYWY
ncbi:putative 39S ribosomal protein L24, mitochondrial, partial [Fragariocoptes setiger]